MARSAPKKKKPAKKKLTSEASLKLALKKGNSERPAQEWLEKHPLVVSQFSGGFAFANKVISQFKFGTDYIADFVAVGSFSGGCCVHFIELEPPNAKLYTKAGIAAGRLNGAISQINEWRVFVDKNKETVLKEISKRVKSSELVAGLGLDVFDNTGRPIWDPKLWIHWHYHIVIGRRATLSQDDTERKASYPGINIATYDRFLDYAGAGHAPVTKHIVTAIFEEKDRLKAQRLFGNQG